MSTTFKVIGVYRIAPTAESIIRAADFQKYHWLVNDKGSLADTIRWENFRNLSLVEIQASGDFSPKVLQTISQTHSEDIDGREQAPYLEYYLDESGRQLLSEKEASATANRRLCFFLHFTDTSLPLRIGEALIKLPLVSELPERLTNFTHYVPPD